MAIENITRFVQYRDTKSKIELITGSLEEAALSFATDTGQLGLYTNGGWAWFSQTGSAGAGGIPERSIPIYDEHVFVVTGTVIDFVDNLTVIASGSVAFIQGQASGVGTTLLPIFDNSVFKVTGTAISFDDNLSVVVTGTVAFVYSQPSVAVYKDPVLPKMPVPNNTGTVVRFDLQLVDTDNLVTTGTAWKFTANQIGYYLVTATFLFQGTSTWAATERGLLQIFKNNAEWVVIDRIDNYDSVSNVSMFLRGTTVVQLNSGDFVDARITQNSGGTLTGTSYNISIAKL